MQNSVIIHRDPDAFHAGPFQDLIDRTDILRRDLLVLIEHEYGK